MTKYQSDMDRVNEHRRQLDTLETAHLIDMWNASSEESWTPEGLEAIRQILLERLGTVPPRQNPPPISEQSEEADTYHDPNRMMSLSSRLDSLSWIFVVLAGLSAIAFVGLLIGAITEIRSAFTTIQDIVYLGASLITFLQTFLVSLTLAFVLRASSEGLLLLMDIEDNTRKREPAP